MVIKDTIRNCIIILMGSILIGLLLLVGVFSLPTQRMKHHVFENTWLLQEEGDYSEFLSGKFVRLHPYNMELKTLLLNNRGMARDNHTDALMLGAAAFDDGGVTSAMQKALLVYHDESVMHRMIDSLSAYAENGVAKTPEAYPRYWHGYLVVLKPLLLLFTYRQIRYLNVVLLLTLYGMAVLGLFRRNGIKPCANFIFASLMTFPIVIPFCMQYCTMTYITLGGMNYMLWHKSKGENKHEIEFFFLIGILVAYIDFLTYPVMALGCLLIVRTVIVDRKVQIREQILLCFSWAAGYGTMWASKWLLADIFTDKRVIRDALNQAIHRTVGSSDQLDAHVNPIKSVAANLSCFTNVIFITLILLIVTVWIVGIIRNGWDINALNYLFIMFLPIIWMCVLQNHSYDHSSYTYRSLVVSFWSLLQTFGVDKKTVVI